MTTIDALNTPNLVLNPSEPRNDDPFESSTPKQEDRKASHRFSAFDTQLFASYQPAASPATAKRALEAHLSETDRRLEEASKLGTALVQQRQDLTEKLKEVEEHLDGEELGPELRQKLAEVEKEYNELGRETARAFLSHKSRAVSGDGETPARSASPTKFSSQATDSPSKMSVPSRKQRNRQTNPVGDIEFVTEISTSLLSQVRQLQNLLLERDELLKTTTLDKSRLKTDNESLLTRLKALDENEQKYKDENWSLETQTHELMAAARESAAREQKMQQTLALVTSQKSAAQRELDDVKQAHGKISDDLAASKKTHDAETSGLRKNALAFETERNTMQKKIDELNMQNQELAQAMAGRFRQSDDTIIPHLEPEPEEFFLDATDTDHSPPPSPTKGAARNSLLESETLKSSLHHAHRMIQTLKSNIHREKTEKLELKRMLQETRDEIEQRRSDPSASKRSKTKSIQDAGKKNIRIGQLGAGRHSQNTIEMLDPDWSDNAEETSRPGIARAFTGDTTTDTYQTATETEDNFETADEEPIESEAFRTGNEGGDSSAELTETETSRNRAVRPQGKKAFPTPYSHKKRDSFISTASTSDEENSLTPPILGSVKYRGKPGEGNRRSRFASEEPGSSPAGIRDSPASFLGASNGQSLFAELEDYNGVSDEDVASTPDRLRSTPMRGPGSSFVASPSKLSSPFVRADPPKAAMVDSSMMTEAWQPETPQGSSILAAPVVATKTDSPTILSKTLSPSTPVKTARDTATQFSPFNTPLAKEKTPQPSTPISRMRDTAVQSSPYNTPVPPSRTIATGTPRGAPVERKPLRFSSITSADIKPKTPPVETTKPSNDIADATKDVLVASGLTGLLKKKPSITDGRTAAGQAPVSTISTPQRKTSFRDLSPDIGLRTLPSPAPKIPLPVPMADAGAQTMLSSNHIDNILTRKPSFSLPLSVSTVGLPRSEALASAKLESPAQTRPGSQQSHTYSFTPKEIPYPPSKSPKRPGSSQSTRSAIQDAPPLPADLRQALTAPVKDRVETKNDTNMGPPTMTAATYRASQKKAQKNIEPQSPGTAGNITPVARYSALRSMRSRKSSMSSFESELDARFNIRTANLPMGGWDSGADPRMIQAITQTMIGEYLWKYTRKAGRGEMSNKRHRRFFWVHPYTRTLYWGEQDPTTADRMQLKAKSVAIEAVRVVADDNPMPPGLHRKSLVVITPGRDIKFTATTGQRHETWFNALSYLLLRTADGQTPDSQALTAEDVAEFNPGLGHGRSSRVSLSTYNSRTNTTRRSLASSLRGQSPDVSTIRAPATSYTMNSARSNYANNQSTVGSRISSLLRPSRSSASGFQARPGSSQQQGSIYNASVVNDSAEDVRKVLERQDQDADTLENVRACCDGKHDVGSLTRKPAVGRASSHRH